MQGEAIVNRVAQSGLVTFNLEDLRPEPPLALDIKDQLYMGLMLREKDFREWVKAHGWAQYAGRQVAIFCSADAIVPTWAYMLVASALQPHAAGFAFATPAELTATLWRDALASHDWAPYAAAKVVVKGCGGDVPVAAYVEAMRQLQAVASKLMYGEPCSTVPLWRRPA